MNQSRSTLILGAAAALVSAVVACTDVAKPDYERCLALEKKGDISAAIDACKTAARTGPTTKYGGLARDKASNLERESRAKSDRLEAERQDVEVTLTKAKKDFDDAIAQERLLKQKIDDTSDVDEKASLQKQLDAVEVKKTDASRRLSGAGATGSGKHCNCPPSDPLCSCP